MEFAHFLCREVRTVPSLFQAVTDAAKLIKNPMEDERARGRPTVYDTWQHYYPPNTKWLPEVPKMNLPGGGSDHM
jgi:hypothetical protein